jgi:hypothetical protein
MRRVLFLSAAMLAGASGAAWADCTSPRLTEITGTFTDMRICATGPTGSWKELHRSDGNVEEQAQGPSSPADVVATWRVEVGGLGLPVITYDYGTGGKYTYNVHQNGGANNYSFCNILTPTTVAATGNLVAGSCP